MSFSISVPLQKVDESRHEIYGRATQQVIDRAGEMMDYDSSKPYFLEWSNDFAKRTNGKSYGAIRQQHDSKKAIGKIIKPLSFNDEDKAIDICVKVVDENAWKMVTESVLTAFSIGGSYGKQWIDEDGVSRYTAIPTEISLVDQPACPTAVIEFIKADGTIEEKTFSKKEVSNVDKDKEMQVEAVEKAVETETVEKTAVEIEPKDEPKPEVEKTSVEIDSKQEEEVKDEAKKADEPAGEESDDKDDEKEVEKSAEVAKEDVFEMCSKAMDNADDSVKEKCYKLFHKMVEKGLACKCDKCAKAVESVTAEKAAADTDLHKAASVGEKLATVSISGDELAKAMGVIDELKKGFDALKSDNEALKKQVEALENTPVAGGAMVSVGAMALNKTIGGNVGNPPAENGEVATLKKMIAETDSAIMKEAYSKQLAQLEMKKVFG